MATKDVNVLRRALSPTKPVPSPPPPTPPTAPQRAEPAPALPVVSPPSQPAVSPAARQRRGFVLGMGGLTFQSEISGLFGVEDRGNCCQRFGVVRSRGANDQCAPEIDTGRVHDVAQTLEALTGFEWEFDGKISGVYWGGGAKYLVSTNGPVRPYVVGGVSAVYLKASIREMDLGEVLDDLIDDGYFDEDDFRGTRFGFEAGGGVSIMAHHRLLFDVSYRYMRIGEINLSIITGGFGVRF